MIGLVQRVRGASVRVADEVVGAIETGLLLMVCAERGDATAQAERLVDKVLALRIFADERGRMNLDLRQVGGGLLIVSQFTLAAELRGGNRPSFDAAAPYETGRALYDEVLRVAHLRHAPVQAGVFGADMAVALVNDGPVTIPIRL